MKIILLIFVTVLLMLIIICLIWFIKKQMQTYHINQNQVINCIMITGKDASREQFAQRSLANFREQSYASKRLIIINHASYTVLNKTKENNEYEFYVDKDTHSLSLGQLRNISLNLVPINEMWTTWDDDDVRSSNYLELMYEILCKNDADVVSLARRIEYNQLNEFVWQIKQTKGLPIILAKQDLRVRYLNTNTMEDINLLDDFRKVGNKVHIDIGNNPFIYIRTVHDNNTSLYVSKDKNTVNGTFGGDTYSESNVTPKEAMQVKYIMKR